MPDQFYKVIKRTYDKRLLSFVYSSLPSTFQVEYKVGEFVYPKKKQSGLFVFGSLWSAREFAGTVWDTNEIYECEVLHPRPIERLAKVTEENILNFWKVCKKARLQKIGLARAIKRNWSMFDGKSAPDNSYWVSAVKLIRKIN